MQAELKKKAKEEALKKLESEIPPQAPAFLKPLFMCCGVVKTVKMCKGQLPPDAVKVADPLIAKIEEP